jgi:hypothetical protein
VRDLRFYETAAQIIPILLLAALIEFRYFERAVLSWGEGLIGLAWRRSWSCSRER